MAGNGREKLIAKIQHFYDSIQNMRAQNEDLAITCNEPQEKEQRRVISECYAVIGTAYSEVFKECLYNAESP